MKNEVLLIAVAALLSATLRADRQDFVIVSATASEAYTQRKIVNGAPRSESYVFLQGKLFAGTRDPSIARTSFMDIAKILAPSLAKQNYLPSKDAKAADLLIVVSWGTTLTEPGSEKSDTAKQFEHDGMMSAISNYNAQGRAQAASPGLPPSGTNPGDMNTAGFVAADAGAITANMMAARGAQISAQSYAGFNARLLGYSNAVNREESRSWSSPDGLNDKAETYLADLTEERYFIILLAYDYQKILRDHDASRAQLTNPFGSNDRAGPAPQPKPIWSVRMNIRSAGNNFTQALPAMSQAATDYFGRQMDDLVTAQTAVGSRAHVEVGEPKALNVVK